MKLFFFRKTLALAASLLALFLTAVSTAHAVPASPEPSQIEQPDGSTFQSFMRGDEFQGWAETADGYTIIKNERNGFFEYATQGDAGILIPSGIPISAAGVAKMTAQGLPPKGLRPPRNTALEHYQGEFLNTFGARSGSSDARAAPAQTGTWSPTPVSGAKKILVILVGFQDKSLSSGAATYWSNAVHSASSGASVAQYYQDNSYGKVSISPVLHSQPGNPTGVVSVSLAQNHPNQGGDYTYAVESAWINKALLAAAPFVDFAGLDTNGDGTISVDETLIYFIVAGYETSAGSNLSPSYWAHAWGGSGVSVSGKNVNHWALNGERYDATNLMRMGVIAHEMGHAMGGLPDLYDIAGYNEGLGIFSLMASGSWGAKSGEIGGATPVSLDAWSRQYLGWSTPQFPSNGSTASFVSPLASASSSGSTVMLMNSSISSSEYWLVENRPPVSWDAGMARSLGSSWTGGLLIQHIDLNVGSKSSNSFNKYVAGSHQGNLVEEPSTATCSLKAASTAANSSRGCPTLLYYSANSTTFNGGSTPNSNFYSGVASSLGISGISAPGSTMTGIVQTVSSSTTNTLSVHSSGAAGVVISASPTTYAGTTNYSKTGIAAGTSITLTAPASAGGATFSSWSGCNTTSGVICSITMSSSLTVTASYGSSAGINLLQNPGFENGVAPWVEYSSGGLELISMGVNVLAHSGDYRAFLGGYDSAIEYIEQSVTIPANTSTASADFWYRISSYETTLVNTWDTLRVDLYNAAGTVKLTTLTTLSNLNVTGEWVKSPAFDVSAYKGQTVRLRFTASTDISNITSFFVDDVSVVALTPSVVSYTITATASPAAGGTVACTPNPVNSGSNSTCTATPNSGYRFTAWSGDCTGTGSCILSNVTAAKNVTAGFMANASINTTLTLKTTPNPSQPGQSVSVSVVVTPLSNGGALSGSVAVSGDGQSCRITLPDASCSLIFSSKGVKQLTAAYSGNSFYSPSTGSTTHFVGQRASLTPILMLLLD